MQTLSKLLLSTVLSAVSFMAFAAAGPLCAYQIGTGTGRAYLRWETDDDGNVNIYIDPFDKTAETDPAKLTGWRGRGMANDLTAAKGWSMTIDGVDATLAEYFDKNYTAPSNQAAHSTVYQLKIKDGMKAQLDGHTVTITKATTGDYICWYTPGNGNAYAKYAMEYLYGSTCASLAAPENVTLTNNVLTFDAVTGAVSYKVYYYLGSTALFAETVTSGATLARPMKLGGTYSVAVSALDADGTESDLSDKVNWVLSDLSETSVGSSEFCSYTIGSGNSEAAMTWVTDENGNIVISINGNNATWRGTAFVGPSNFIVGRVPGNAFFTQTYASGSDTYTLTLKTGAQIALGETITYKGSLQWQTPLATNAYVLNQTLTYTYGTSCQTASKPVINSISDAQVLDVTAEGAEKFDVKIMLGGTLFAQETVTAGAALTFVPRIAGATYQVSVVAKAEGIADSEESDPYNWTPTNIAPAYVPTTSEIKSLALHSDGVCEEDLDAFLSFTTEADGRIVVTLHPFQGEPGTQFRGNGLDLSSFSFHNGTPLTPYFDASVSGCTYTLTPKAGMTIPYGTVLKYGGNVGWQSTGCGNAYLLNRNYSFTYGNTYTNAAPVLTATYSPLDGGAARVTMSATDDVTNPIYFTVTCNGETKTITAQPGAETSVDFTGLGTGVDYPTVVEANDGIVAAESKNLTIRLAAADNEAPSAIHITATPLSLTSGKLTLYAEDNYAGNLTYTIVGTGITEPVVANQGTTAIVPIADLTAGTAYNYTVTVTDAAGNSAAPVPVTLTTFSENIALNKSATAGASQFAPAGAVDGLTTGDNRWGSNVGSATHPADDWWQVNLGTRYNVQHIRMFWNNARPTHYKLLYSVDDINWSEIEYTTTPEKDVWVDYELATPIEARFLKVQSLANFNAYGISIVEFEAFGTAIIDTEAPQNLTLTGEALDETSVRLTMSATDNFYGTLSYDVYADGTLAAEGLTELQGVSLQTTIASLSAGEHDFYFVVKDASSNQSTSSTISLTLLSTGDNILLSKLATAGSTEAGHGADKAVDGNPATYWGNYGKAVFDEHNNWLAVDMLGTYAVERVSITWQHFPDYAGFVLQARNYGEEWTTIYTHTGAKATGTQVIDLASPVTANELRVFSEGATNTWYMAISEIKAFGDGKMMLYENIDNVAHLEHINNKTIDIDVDRSFIADGYWYTLCLPFDLSADEMTAAFGAGYTLAKLNDAYMSTSDMLHIDFVHQANLEAGVPYLFMPGANVVAPIHFTSVTIDANAATTLQRGLVAMTGFYKPTVVGSDNYFLGNNNYLKKNNDSTATKAFRCYFTLNESVPSNVRARVVTRQDAPTDIEEMTSTNGTEKVLRDATIYIIRDGQTYTIQGQRID